MHSDELQCAQRATGWRDRERGGFSDSAIPALVIGKEILRGEASCPYDVAPKRLQLRFYWRARCSTELAESLLLRGIELINLPMEAEREHI